MCDSESKAMILLRVTMLSFPATNYGNLVDHTNLMVSCTDLTAVLFLES